MSPIFRSFANAPLLAATLLAATAVGSATLTSACEKDREYKARPPTEDRKLIVLGIDGMDPKLLRKYMREGRVPHLAKLAERGTFLDLQTTNPPQSPVAWSAFITGLGLGGHGIYDFVHRDPMHLGPYLSTSRPIKETSTLGISTGGGGHELLREGEAFWQTLEKQKVGATVVKIPANFPPAKTNANESMSGMGTPDILGTYGTFQVFTDNPDWKEKKVSAGEIHMVDFSSGDSASSSLVGPGENASVRIDVDKEQQMAALDLDGVKVLLKQGEWSEWTPVDFGTSLTGSPKFHGIVRFYLRSVAPFHLYVSPINIDPIDPLWDVSEPPSWSEDMAKSIGRFYTQGMAEDTKALTGGALTDEEFLAQGQIVFQERIKMLRHEMKRYRGGLFFFYFSSIDQQSHMYYGSLAPDAPEHYAKYKHVVPELYEQMDKVVGEVLEWAGDTPVLIMSDHGFAHWTYKVHLNSWLAQQGYLALNSKDKMGEGILGHIDWEKTQAYALGLNQLFLNLEGREAHGVVTADEKDVVLQRLKRDLESWRYAETGERVVTKAMVPEVGTYGERAPDLIVGYNKGFRSSDDSANGRVGNAVIELNDGHWNGDHCMHASHVPGVLLSTEKLPIQRASLIDFAPTILRYFGITPPPDMKGQDLFGADHTAGGKTLKN